MTKLDAGSITTLPASDSGIAAVWGSKRINLGHSSACVWPRVDALQTMTTTTNCHWGAPYHMSWIKILLLMSWQIRCYDYTNFELVKNYVVFLDKYLPNCSQQKTLQKFALTVYVIKKVKFATKCSLDNLCLFVNYKFYLIFYLKT